MTKLLFPEKNDTDDWFDDEEMLIIDLSNVYDQYCWEHGTNVSGGIGGVWLITHCPDCVEKDIREGPCDECGGPRQHSGNPPGCGE